MSGDGSDSPAATALCLRGLHTSCVTHLEFLQSDLLSASLDKTIKLSQLTDGKWSPIRTYEGHTDGVQCVYVLGPLFVSAADDGLFCVHRLSDPAPVFSHRFGSHGGINCVVPLFGNADLASPLDAPVERAPDGTLSGKVPFALGCDTGELIIASLIFSWPASASDPNSTPTLGALLESYQGALVCSVDTLRVVGSAHGDAINALVACTVAGTEGPERIFLTCSDDGRVGVWSRELSAMLPPTSAVTDGGEGEAKDAGDGTVAVEAGGDVDALECCEDSEAESDGDSAAVPESSCDDEPPYGCSKYHVYSADILCGATFPLRDSNPSTPVAVVGARQLLMAIGVDGVVRRIFGGPQEWVRRVAASPSSVVAATDDGSVFAYGAASGVSAKAPPREDGEGTADADRDPSAAPVDGDDDGVQFAEPFFADTDSHRGEPIFGLAVKEVDGQLLVASGDNEGVVVVRTIPATE